MKYALLVAWREYAECAKAKGFWIGIFLLPAILFLSIQAPIWLHKKATPIRYFVVVDQSTNLAPMVESALEKSYQRSVFNALKEYARKHSVSGQEAGTRAEKLPETLEAFMASGGRDSYLVKLQPRLKPGSPAFLMPRRLYQPVPLPKQVDPEVDLGSVAEALKPFLTGQKQFQFEGRSCQLAAAILIPRDVAAHIVRPQQKPRQNPEEAGPGEQIQYWSANADTSLREEIERAINSEIRRREYLAQGMDAAAVRAVEQTYAPVASLNPKKEKGKETISTADQVKQWAPSGFVYLLWMAIFVIVQMLLNNTIEEKSNRIIEVLLSSVTPGELMMGKLIGIAGIGLTMIGAWMAALFGILSWKASGTEVAGQILTVLKGSNLVWLFTVYFLLGYLMYAGFILSIGSVCNTIKEAQSYMSVLTMVMMVPLLTITFIPRDPNGPLARLLSWIPIYTPFTMMNRAAADPPLIDLVGTLVLLIATTALALWMCGKIFRIGVLRTGQPPRLVEMFRWAIRRDQ